MSSEQISDRSIPQESLTIEQVEANVKARAKEIEAKVKALERSQYPTQATMNLRFSPVPPIITHQ